MALIKCPECGKMVSNLAMACPECGFPIQEYVSKHNEMHECPECGTLVSKNAVKCPECGFPLDGNCKVFQKEESETFEIPTSNDTLNYSGFMQDYYESEELNQFIEIDGRKKYNDCWFWILTIAVPIIIFVAENVKPGVTITLGILFAIGNCVLIVLDDYRLKDSGQNVHFVWKALGITTG